MSIIAKTSSHGLAMLTYNSGPFWKTLSVAAILQPRHGKAFVRYYLVLYRVRWKHTEASHGHARGVWWQSHPEFAEANKEIPYQSNPANQLQQVPLCDLAVRGRKQNDNKGLELSIHAVELHGIYMYVFP